MNLPGLLTFLPLVIASFLAYHLIFKQQLPAKSLLAVVSYFLGIIIIFAAIFWLVTTFLADWAVNLLQEGTTSEWQQFIDASENIFENALGTNSDAPSPVIVTPTPARIIIVATPTPLPGGTVLVVPEDDALTGPTQYTVVPGDTLYGIARRFNTTVNDIMIANGLTAYTIHPGQVLTIPAPSRPPN
ncbi:MAG TPA: LysM peptidoglycan-binding domain-containing protein [Anaerolineae bacterium]